MKTIKINYQNKCKKCTHAYSSHLLYGKECGCIECSCRRFKK